MKRPLAVGDKVRVYGCRYSSNHSCLMGKPHLTIDGVITEIMHGAVHFRTNGEDMFVVNPKQCRRLIPKKPRKRVWIKETPIGLIAEGAIFEEQKEDGWTQFIEVRKKK